MLSRTGVSLHPHLSVTAQVLHVAGERGAVVISVLHMHCNGPRGCLGGHACKVVGLNNSASGHIHSNIQTNAKITRL